MELYRAIFEFAPDAVLVVDRDGLITEVNTQAERLFRYERSALTGRPIEVLIPSRFAAAHAGHRAAYVSEPQVRPMGIGLGLYATRGDGTEFPVDIMLSPLQTDAGSRVIAVVRDVTEPQRAVEHARIESEARLRLAQQAARIGSFEWNVQTGVNIWTPELETMYGLQSGEFGQTQPAWESLIHPDDREAAKRLVLNAMESGVPTEGEWRVVWRDGSTHWIFGRFQAFRDSRGNPLRLTGVNLDITQRKQAEAELRRTRDELEARVRERTTELLELIREKDVLLKEIHHRVKNNLAIVSSLLYLQADDSRDPHVVKSLGESRDRLRAMSLIHETLYQSGNLAEVDFAEYARALTEHLMATYRVVPDAVRLAADFQRVTMKLETAIPCGLILNELISNVLKHAYPDGRCGEVRVSVTQDDVGTVSLTVLDDGVGVSAGIDVSKSATLGLRLIHTLARQIDGQFELRAAAPGTQATLRFRSDVEPCAS